MSRSIGREDKALVSSVLGGRREDFGTLVRRYQPAVFAVALAHTGNMVEAEDVVQESFLKAYQALDSLRTPSTFGPWLITITKNACRDTLRKRQRESLMRETQRESLPAPDISLARKEVTELLTHLMGQLDEGPRELLIMYYFSGKRTGEIARLLGISANAATKRLQRARDALGRKLVDAVARDLQPPENRESLKRLLGVLAAAPVPWSATTGAAASSGAFGLITSKGLGVGAVLVSVVVGAFWFGRSDSKSVENVERDETVEVAVLLEAETLIAEEDPAINTDPGPAAQAIENVTAPFNEADAIAAALARRWPVAIGQDLHSPDGETPLAWYLLKQPNLGASLTALPHRIRAKVAKLRERDLQSDGGNSDVLLELNIAVEGNVRGDILIGFFDDAGWSLEPRYVLSFPGPGDYVIDTVEPGQYVLGALVEEKPDPNRGLTGMVLGVHETWPYPVSVDADAIASTRVLVTRDFRFAQGLHGTARSILEELYPDAAVSGSIRGPDGKPIPYPLVLIREYVPPEKRRGSIAAPDVGGDAYGRYYYDRMTWPYILYAEWNDFLPEGFSQRYQQLKHSEPLRGLNVIDFEFEEWRQGSAIVTGTVTDQDGMPVTNVFLRVSSLEDWDPVTKTSHAILNDFVAFPFMNSEGAFRVEGLRAGHVGINVLPFQHQNYDRWPMEEYDLHEGETTEIYLQLVAKGRFYGRVLYRDGSPALPDHEKFPQAKTKAVLSQQMTLSMGMYRDTELDHEGYFIIHLSDQEFAALAEGGRQTRLTIEFTGFDDSGRREKLAAFPMELLSRSKGDVRPLIVE